MADLQSFGLAGRVAIVTGGTRGIGLVVARLLQQAGCQVAVCGRTPPEMQDAAAPEFYPCDVRQADQARAFVDDVATKYGRLDIVVNNAGGSPQAEAASASPRFSEAIIGLNLLAPLHIAQAANKYMQAQDHGGAIINIASISAIRPSPGTAAYGAAKAGLLSLTQSLAQEWGPKVRVNAIVAGLLATETAEQTYGSAESQARIEETLPLKRMGRGEDIAHAVMYLASELSSYVSGAQLAVHGGGETPLFLKIVEEQA